MKVILVNKTIDGKSYSAHVNGYPQPTGYGTNEIEALKMLLDLLEKKNPKFIQRGDWEKKTDKELEILVGVDEKGDEYELNSMDEVERILPIVPVLLQNEPLHNIT